MRKTSILCLLMAALFICLFTGPGGAEAAGGDPLAYTVDLTGSNPVTVPRDVINMIMRVQDSPFSEAELALDFNLDGVPDASVTEDENDDYVLKRLPGADQLTENYTYSFVGADYDSVTFKVYEPVTDVSLNKAELFLSVGEEETLAATILPSGATNKAVLWTSSSDAVATVDSSGKVTAVAPGTATVMVTTMDNCRTATCEVTVLPPPAVSVVINASKATYYAVETKKYSCVLKTATGDPLPNALLTLKVNGKTYKAKTNANGKATFNLSKLKKAGEYKATIKFAQTGTYPAAGKKVTIVVKKSLYSKNCTVKKSAKKLVVKCTLKGKGGKKLKGKNITFKFNGKTYKSKTNNKGIATFTIKKTVLKKLKAGKSYTGKFTYSGITLKIKVKVKK